MTILNTTNTTSSDLFTTRSRTHDLRLGGAPDAPGFAQVLQAFDRNERTSVVESASEPDSPATQDRDSDDQVTESTREQDARSEGERTEGAEPRSDASADANADPSASQGEQVVDGAQGESEAHVGAIGGVTDQAKGPDGQPNPEATQTEVIKRELSGFDLLNNKSDQAKLSIRGLVRAIRADVAQDSTTLAVQTRLGQTPTSVQPTPETTPLEAQPDSVDRPVQRKNPGLNSTRDPRDALSDSPPVSDRGTQDSKRTPSVPGTPLTAAKDAPSEQLRVDTNQNRSARADATTHATSQTRTGEPVRTEALHATVRTETLNRVEGALTARAVGGIEAGQTRQGIEQQAGRLDQALKPTPNENQTLQSKLIAQVQRGLASLMRSTSGEMTLRLTPERLGELKIEIKRSGEQLAVRLTTQSAEARDLLSAGTDELSQLLRAKGIDLDRVQIEHQSSSNQGQGAFDLNEHTHDGSRDASDQHDHHQRTTSAPSEHQGTGPDDGIDEPTDIWTELGLDAIA
jgi:flagellar hook-length control protein FliK